MVNIPPQLVTPTVVAGRVSSKVMQDLTVYLAGPSELEFEFLIDFYQNICPSDRLVKYKLTEFDFWTGIARPVLTASGRVAAAAGVKRPYLEPVRRRIRDGRAFDV